MRPRILGPLAVAVLTATAALAQVNYEPTPPPDTSATDRSWYLNGDPIAFAGDLYYQTGPTIYFNGNTMVATGSYDGVTLYADTTLEPYSLVFVPVGGSLVRPYERLRSGDLAGTTGSRMPTFPVQISRYPRSGPRRDVQDQRPPQRQGGHVRPPRPRLPPPPEASEPVEEPQGLLLVQTARKPNDNAGIWVSFQGYHWEHAGEAVTLDSVRLSRVGDYYGLAVYTDARTPYVIYIPWRANLVTPFRRTGP
jgi:hypothetical protein